MALMHWAAKYISRKKGKSVMACAAYQAGACLVDARTGKRHDYRRKAEVVHSAIITPDNSPAPSRKELWDMAEAAEKRNDAKTAWQLVIALPLELSREQREELAQALAEDIAETKGCVVDMCVHAKPNNPHVHLLCTIRQWQGGKLGKRTADTWDTKTRKAHGITTRTDADLYVLRCQQADIINAHLARAGSAARVDPRSYRDQGKQITPTVHLGPAVTAMEAKGQRTDLGDYNRQAMADRQAESLSQPIESKPKKRLSNEELREVLRENLAGPTPKPRPQ